MSQDLRIGSASSPYSERVRSTRESLMNQPNRRVDLYTAVHKGLRACMAHVLVEAGRMDTADAEDTERALELVRDLLLLCRAHLEHEDTFLHGAMEARQIGRAS